MKVLNLDPQFKPLGTGVEFDKFVFNGGEPHLKISTAMLPADSCTITTRVANFQDMGFLMLAADALRRMGVSKLKLILPYFPAARQDRLMVPGEPLSVKVYANLINGMGFENVTIFDPHSEVAPALLDKVTSISNAKIVGQIAKGLNDFYLIAPDAGSVKKAMKLGAKLEPREVIVCGKTRELKTGKLSGFKVYSEDLEHRTCLVVDDICDGGGTFIGLAQELKKKNAGKLILFVSHGIFSKGTVELSQYYDEIITTDSFSTLEDVNVRQVELTEELLEFEGF